MVDIRAHGCICVYFFFFSFLFRENVRVVQSASVKLEPSWRRRWGRDAAPHRVASRNASEYLNEAPKFGSTSFGGKVSALRELQVRLNSRGWLVTRRVNEERGETRVEKIAGCGGDSELKGE